MKITRLGYQKKDPNRVNVYVDGKFAVGLNVNDVIKLGLANNQEINQEELNKIIENSNFGKAFSAVLNFLSFRPRSEFEIRQYLARKMKNKKEERKKLDEENREIVEKVIIKLREIGQINDEEFARWYVEQRQTFRPKGRRAVKYELLKKGVDKKIIDKVLPEGENELSLALKAARKKKLADPVKLQRFLASRGFDWETIKEAVEKLSGGEYNNT